ncbi:hypothetical protein GEMRC1_010073 [Eukaryota sp. GEM-RC1]
MTVSSTNPRKFRDLAFFVPPKLATFTRNEIQTFLEEVDVYTSITDKKHQVTLRLMLDPVLLRSLHLSEPDLEASDEALLEYLKRQVQFSTYEEFNQTISGLRMDVRIGEPRERMNEYLRRFVRIRDRAESLSLPDKVLVKRFARGICPKGLSSSLISRINNELITSLPEVISVASDELLDLSRVSSWLKKDSSVLDSLPAVESRNQQRSNDRKRNICFKCHRSGHKANECSYTAKEESINSIIVDEPKHTFDNSCYTNPIKKAEKG